MIRHALALGAAVVLLGAPAAAQGVPEGREVGDNDCVSRAEHEMVHVGDGKAAIHDIYDTRGEHYDTSPTGREWRRYDGCRPGGWYLLNVYDGSELVDKGVWLQ